MKLVALALSLVLWPPLASTPPASTAPPVDATVTRSGEVISVGFSAPHVLQFSANRAGAVRTFDLELATLPGSTRVVAVKLGPYDERGIAAAIAVDTGTNTEYRWLFTLGDPLMGQLLVAGPDAKPSPSTLNGWTLSPPLFTSIGAPYRLLDIHNPGGDSLELTFRRGNLQGMRQSTADLVVDERIVHDACASGTRIGLPGSNISVTVDHVTVAR